MQYTRCLKTPLHRELLTDFHSYNLYPQSKIRDKFTGVKLSEVISHRTASPPHNDLYRISMQSLHKIVHSLGNLWTSHLTRGSLDPREIQLRIVISTVSSVFVQQLTNVRKTQRRGPRYVRHV